MKLLKQILYRFLKKSIDVLKVSLSFLTTELLFPQKMFPAVLAEGEIYIQAHAYLEIHQFPTGIRVYPLPTGVRLLCMRNLENTIQILELTVAKRCTAFP